MDPYTGVIAWNSAEGGVDGTTVTTANSGGSSGTAWSTVQLQGSTTVTHKAAGALHDNISYEVIGNGGWGMMQWRSSILGTSLTNIYGAAYIKITALPASYTNIIFGQSTDAGTGAWRIKVSSTGNFRLSDNADATVASTTTTPVSLNTTYRFEWHINHTTGLYLVELFAGDSTSALASLSGTAAGGASAFGPQTQRVDFGRTSAPDFSALYDTMAINNAALGPRAGGAVAGTANAGADQAVEPMETVTLTGAGSTDATTYAWAQLSGTAVTLSGANTVSPTFTAPAAFTNQTLTFRLTVNGGSTDTVSLLVYPHVEWYRSGGQWRPQKYAL